MSKYFLVFDDAFGLLDVDFWKKNINYVEEFLTLMFLP